MATAYDSNVLIASADKLYSRAKGIAFGYAVRGLALGGIAGALFTHGAANATVPIAGAAVVCAVVGYAIGWEKSFTLRLEAQRTLCAMQTEMNTRPPPTA